MFAIGRAISIAAMLVAAAPATAQVINGESTYGDSDLHQPPADTTTANDKAKDPEPSRPRSASGQR